jgi:hypothetical protein
MSSYHPASLHTIHQIAFLYDLTTAQTTALRRHLNGKAAQFDDHQQAWYRWCDVIHALDACLASVEQPAWVREDAA